MTCRRRAALVAGCSTAPLIIGLAPGLGLALGLGLDLKHHNHSSSLASSTNSSGWSLPPLQPAPQDNFVLNGLAGQSLQTCLYDFVISQVQGAPDGVSKLMLVVNGMYPDLTIARIVVNFTNSRLRCVYARIYLILVSSSKLNELLRWHSRNH